MFSFIVKRCVLPLAATAAAMSAHAQGAAAAPAQASQPAPVALGFESAFKGYQPFNEQKVGSWKAANDTVGRIGGWRAYAKEANEGAAAPQQPPAGAASPHSGHGKH